MAHTTHYTGTEDMPAHRWHEFNFYLLVEASAGKGVEGIEGLCQTGLAHLQNEEPHKVQTILTHILQNIHFAKEQLSPLSLAYAATVQSIDGQDVSSWSAEKVRGKLQLSQTTIGKLKSVVYGVKKKWRRKWSSSFRNRRTTRSRATTPTT